MASQVSEAFLRLDTLVEHTENVYQALVTIARTNQNLHTEPQERNHRRRSRQVILESLSPRLLYFFTGLQLCFDNKFSPLLVDPEKVQDAYDEVVDKAKEG